ncbi:CocE/NonD family hydrolase [Streptomyces europaeiscabiei]|uniref:CocE/NonD family hydrolase n=1 Tax=Streptomyces europaeiscabiei TaxID=146819 RepID=UPI0029C9F6B1|nr:CocE/NonD family hydrolase [Streptomyces europaeiscabiei]
MVRSGRGTVDARRRDRTRHHRALVPHEGCRRADAPARNRPRHPRRQPRQAGAGSRRPGRRRLRRTARRALPHVRPARSSRAGRSRREPEWARACRVEGWHDEVDLPTFQVGGWYDIFTQGTLDNFTAMRRAGRSATLVMGPWRHANQQHVIGDVNFGFGANSAFMGINQWREVRTEPVTSLRRVSRARRCRTWPACR